MSMSEQRQVGEPTADTQLQKEAGIEWPERPLLLTTSDVERIADAVAKRLWRAERSERQALSLTAAAQILGVDRVRTLPALIACGSVRTIDVAGHTRISRDEIARVLREGAPLVAPVPAKRRRRVGHAKTTAEMLAEMKAIRVEDL